MSLQKGEDVQIGNTHISGTIVDIPDAETVTVKIKEQTIRCNNSEIQKLQEEISIPSDVQQWDKFLDSAQQWVANQSDRDLTQNMIRAMQAAGIVNPH